MVMGDLVREVDVAVIGGGPGGYSAAFRCAELGLEAVIVDADKRLGGACLFEGCIPSKALLHVAAVLSEAERAKEFGVDFGEPRISLDPLRKWKSERVVGKLARGLASVARGKSVDVVGGRAVFEDSRSLRVEGDEPQKIRFKHAIVATGSAPSPLPGVDLKSDRLMDSTAALEIPDIPARLLVIGGGYIGLELGQVYAALGSEVTMVEMLDGLLPGADRDLVQHLARRCERMFKAIRLSTRVSGLRETGGAVEARLGEGETATFDRVLVAVGRRPRTAGLGLEATRARLGERGFVEIDERCRTADPHVWAVGDVTGEPMLAHRAMRQGKVAAEAIAGRPAAFDNVVVPAVVFTDPEVAWCGLSERDAQAAGRTVKVAKFQWAASGRAATLGRADGLTKLVVDPETGRVLGVGIVGPGAGELIAEGALAVETAMLAEDLALTIHTHPTLSETLMEAAETLLR
ncbi:MAG TPA: dihydrolipoyl dehydrogenase [Candidatus Acidoferrum sp.]|jgi:dihydrolipoamide dehydrogenase|nr:dihydrolipoyl dehydrogenase [Candidatus Acidoferrum sp.]